jgi:ankyrin repeat protein
MTDDAHDGATPLYVAAAEGQVDLADLLIARGADVHARDDRGGTPLDYAVANGNRGIADLLRKRGTESPRVAP